MKAKSYSKQLNFSVTLFLLAFILAIRPTYSAPYQEKAENVRANTANFDGNLSSVDTTVQKALETIDEMAGGAGEAQPETLVFIIDGHGSVISASASASGHKVIPISGTITKWEITSTSSGSIVCDVKKSTYAGYDTFASIAGTEKPTISAGIKGTDTSLTTWTTSVTAGDRLQAVVDSADINGIVVLTVYITGS